ncbi:hypothetical protein F0562_022130 [Nyssa sinensis]|uniref:HMA domain-containing protein n=1 Tax=Nyssa sinensis TaxID=561372 RepID=A0A5J5BMZ9_9ASTE|nr:hypothetical protein F0562_022130 [Nyssa sinensis]
MGKKKSKNGGEMKQNDEKKDNNGGGKKDGGSTAVVLKVDMHCDGCATKVKKCIRSFEGVESVKGSDGDMNKITVTGKVDPLKLREYLEEKTRKKFEIVSPMPKKEKESGGGEKKKEDKPDEKKPKEPPVTTAVLKMNLHCEGCIDKIRKFVTKTKGYQEMSFDRQKDLVTVKGMMDMKALAESLKEKFKRLVEIVPPKKEGGDKKEKGGGGGGNEKKEKGGGDGGGKALENMMEYQYVPAPVTVPVPMPYGYPPPYVYGSGYAMEHVHAPQLFSDENPNACSVM